jgi:predicted enzyme related to lactoylglutathione lyase
MDKVVHFEIPVDDVDRAQAFYRTVFGWEVQPIEDIGYTIVRTTPIDEESQLPTEPGAINGGMMRRSSEAPGPSVTIQVASIDEALGRIETEGGSTVRPRTELPGMGAYAYFKDTEGNVGGLWENL